MAANSVSGGAAVRIERDYGGRIGTYIQWFKRLRQSGRQVIVDGDCLSACTLVLGIIPDGRLCVTPRALRLSPRLEAGPALHPGRHPAPVGILSEQDPALDPRARRPVGRSDPPFGAQVARALSGLPPAGGRKA
jgi:hypothetical protein